MEAICTHGMPSPASCYECMEEGNFVCGRKVPAEAPEREGPDIAARYDGHCRACNLGIHVGETICRTTHGTYEHAHHHPQSRWALD